MPKTQDRLSLDEFIIPVTNLIPEDANEDVTADIVQFQFVVGGQPSKQRPTDDGWVNGHWITIGNGQPAAAINVGPGGDVTLDKGKWGAFIKVVDNPTIPVALVDTLTII